MAGPEPDFKTFRARGKAMWLDLHGRWNRWFGNRGERAAEQYLRKQGLRIITRNYRTERGEVDLIARDGDTLVFVEVKTRKSGDPVEAVTVEKQARLTRAALAFMRQHRLLGGPVGCRFDVVAVLWPSAEGKGRPEITHYRDAFEATGVASMHS